MSSGSVRETSRRNGSFDARAPPVPGAPAYVTETDSSVTGRDERFRIIVATLTLAPGAAEGSVATASTQMPRHARIASAMSRRFRARRGSICFGPVLSPADRSALGEAEEEEDFLEGEEGRPLDRKSVV